MLKEMSEWYLSYGGKKSGPLSSKQIARLVAGGAFRAGDALVWKQGMSYWQSVADSGLLAEAAQEPDLPKKIEAKRTADQSPYKAPKASLTPAKEQLGEVSYGGIGRLMFFFAPLAIVLILLVVLTLGFGFSLQQYDATETVLSGAVMAIYLAYFVFMVWIYLARLRNLGMSSWWFLGTIVPFLNIWLSWRMSVCPEGYAQHKQLDLPGKILTFVFIILPLAAVAFLFLSAAGSELLNR